MTEMDSMETLRREKLYLRESIGNRGPRARGADRARVKTLFSHQPLTRQRNLSNLSCHISAYPMGPLNFLFFLLPGEGEKRTRKGPRAAGRAECFPVKRRNCVWILDPPSCLLLLLLQPPGNMEIIKSHPHATVVGAAVILAIAVRFFKRWFDVFGPVFPPVSSIHPLFPPRLLPLFWGVAGWG